MKKRNKKEYDIGKSLINKMLQIAGYKIKYKDLIGVDNWYTKYIMTEEQNKRWIEWAISTIIKKLGVPLEVAKIQMMYFNLNYGLKIKN